MKSAIVHIHDDEGLDGRLSAAIDLCRAHKAHLRCMHVTPYSSYAAFDPAGGMFVSGALLEELNRQRDDLKTRIEAELANEDICWDWESYDGDVAQTLVSASALADLVVLGQAAPASRRGKPPMAIVDDVVANAAALVLLVPEDCNRVDALAPVVIGWNGSEQAARAIRLAVPLLKLASAVHLVSVEHDGMELPQLGASAYLSRHGIASELHSLKQGSGNADEILHRFALDHGAGMLLIGAYGHSRLRETLLGGVTRYLTMKSQLPLLLGR